jgi:hypothetical protein
MDESLNFIRCDPCPDGPSQQYPETSRATLPAARIFDNFLGSLLLPPPMATFEICSLGLEQRG